MSDICVVGAGVAGLAFAFQSEQAGNPVTVFESGDRIGGALKTRRRDGFLLEYGANSILCSPKFFDFVRRVGFEKEVIGTQPWAKKRFIALKSGASRTLRLIPVPQNPVGLITSQVLEPLDRLRLLAEPFFGKSPRDDESIDEFFSRRLGRGFAQRIIAPMMNGVWASDSRSISCRSALPRVWEWEQKYRSLALGLLLEARKMKHADSSVPRGSVGFRNGMESFIECLGSRLKSSKILTSSAATLENTAAFKKLVLTSGAAQSAELLRAEHAALAAKVAQVPAVSVGLLHLAAASEKVRHPLDGFGFVIPPMYGKTTLGALFSSSMFTGRAPGGTHLITCFVSGDPRALAIQDAVCSELDEIIGLLAPPRVIDATFIASAIPNFPVGHHRLQAEVDELHSSQNRIRILSSWYKGLGVPQRIEEAMKW